AGAPLLPVALPGAAVSPGANTCSFVNAPAFTVIEPLRLDAFVPSLMSVAVTVRDPALLSVTAKLPVPPDNAELPGKPALLSEDVIPTTSVAVGARFQLASTALTITLNAVPAVWAVGVPVLPAGVPGIAVSPGASTCSFAKAPALTVIAGLELPALLPSLTSETVSVRVPEERKVTLRVLVPEISGELTGTAALVSLAVSPIVSVTVFTRFQFASTDRTVTVKAEPAVWLSGAPFLPVAVPGAAASPGVNSCSLTKAPA